MGQSTPLLIGVGYLTSRPEAALIEKSVVCGQGMGPRGLLCHSLPFPRSWDTKETPGFLPQTTGSGSFLLRSSGLSLPFLSLSAFDPYCHPSTDGGREILSHPGRRPRKAVPSSYLWEKDTCPGIRAHCWVWTHWCHFGLSFIMSKMRVATHPTKCLLKYKIEANAKNEQDSVPSPNSKW